MIPSMSAENYVQTFAEEVAFDNIDLATRVGKTLTEGNAEALKLLQSVKLGELAQSNLSRNSDLESKVRELAGEDVGQRIVDKGREYPEMPSPNFQLTKTDFLAAATLVASVAPTKLNEMAEGNMFDKNAMSGNGVEVLEAGRISNILEHTKLGGQTEKADVLGQKLVSVVAESLA